jgi:hypothetical protein
MTRARLQTGLVGLFLALALVSSAWRFWPTWDYLSKQRSQFGGFSALDRRQEPGYANALPVDAFEFFRAHLQRGDRYYVAATPGGYIPGVDRPTALRTFARYYLLPAIQVEQPQLADAVLTVGVLPDSLGVPVEGTAQDGSSPFYFARVRR